MACNNGNVFSHRVEGKKPEVKKSAENSKSRGKHPSLPLPSSGGDKQSSAFLGLQFRYSNVCLYLPLCLGLYTFVFSHGLLIRIVVIKSRIHPTPVSPRLNLITSLKTLFPNEIIFTGAGLSFVRVTIQPITGAMRKTGTIKTFLENWEFWLSHLYSASLNQISNSSVKEGQSLHLQEEAELFKESHLWTCFP